EARGDLERRARELTALGHATRGLGDLARARDYFRGGLAASEEIGFVSLDLSAAWGIAACEAEAGDAVTAAQLCGWIEKQRARLGAPRTAYEVGLEEMLRDRLGPERLESEHAAGAALAREDAIDLALGPTPKG